MMTLEQEFRIFKSLAVQVSTYMTGYFLPCLIGDFDWESRVLDLSDSKTATRPCIDDPNKGSEVHLRSRYEDIPERNLQLGRT
jgi:hypothetical protein